MMFRISLLIFLLFLFLSSFKTIQSQDFQKNDSGETILKVDYKVKVLDKIRSGILYLNNSHSLFQWSSIKSDSLYENFDKENMKYELYKRDEKGNFVCKEMNDNSMTSRETPITNTYYVEDTVPKINWSILPETRKIGRFQVQKAVGKFRGREYVVFFTTEIPIQNGPWKLGGLPGLILEGHDKLGKIYFSVNSLKKIRGNDLIIQRCNLSKDTISWDNYKELVKENFKKFEGFMSSKSGFNVDVSIQPEFFLERSIFEDKK